MIVTLEEAKQWIRVDGNHDDALILIIITAAEEYLKNATGKEYDSTNRLARLLCFVLITDWYENREQIGNISGKYRFTVQAILAQLKYRPEQEAGDGGAGQFE